MTRDRSYTSHEEYIFQMCGVESWTELCERAGEIEPIKIFLAEGLVSILDLIRKMTEEQTRDPDANKSKICRRIAGTYGLSYHTVRGYVYQKKDPQKKETTHAALHAGM